jgi:hypothetical protein
MSAPPFPVPGPMLPVIVTTDEELRDIVKAAWDACLAGNAPPSYFRFGSALVRVAFAEGRAHVRNATLPVIFGWLMRSARWLANSDGGLVGAKPPKELPADFLAFTDERLPLLKGLVHMPVLTAARTILISPGYDPTVSLYYAPPSGFALPAISLPVSQGDVQAAVALIAELFADFPFAGRSDFLQAVGLLLSPFVRQAIDDAFPLFGVEASTRGSGKGLLVDCVSIVATGACLPITTLATDESEVRKKITSLLLRGSQIACFDNVSRVDSASIAAVITSTMWSDRMLGHNQQVDLPNKAIWIYTANNPQLSGEIARRTVRIRLSPETERPWERTGFRHPDLRSWVKSNRADLVRAALTLIHNWIAKGCPAGSRSLGSFESWASVVGGILEATGATDAAEFLANRDDFQRDSDPSADEWRQFIGIWWPACGAQSTAVSTLLDLANQHQALTSVLGGGQHASQLARLGRALKLIHERVFDGLQVVGRRSGHAKAALYSLRPVGAP